MSLRTRAKPACRTGATPRTLTFFHRMTTLTFKVDEDEARSLRAAARRAMLTVSESLRRQSW